MRSRYLGRMAAVAALALAGALVPLSGATAFTGEECHQLTADQTYDAGTVCVTQSGANSIEVVFTSVGWVMTEAHLAVVDDPDLFPTAKGNPIPGQFEFQYIDPTGFTTHTFNVDSLAENGLYYIAAHAKVWSEASQTTAYAVSGEGTTRTDSAFTTVLGAAAPANEPGVSGNYPSCAAQSPSDLTKSLWDKNITPSPASFNRFDAAGADWIWDTTVIPLADAITGEVHYFTQEFEVSGLPVTGTGDVYIAADNAFQVEVNSSVLGSKRFGPGFFATDELKEDVGSGPQQGDWGVASQGWQPVGHYTFPVLVGTNVLNVTAANEYQSAGVSLLDGAVVPYGTPGSTYYPPDHYLGWNGSAYTSTVYNDPTPNLTNNCTNPGGVIFMASADYYADSETAWGAYGTEDGIDFDGAKWAAYFSYQLSST